MIRAVIFDLWGTLIVDDPASSEARDRMRIGAAHAALADAGFAYEAADIEAGFLAAGVEHSSFHERELDLSGRGRTRCYLRNLDPSLPDRLDEGQWQRFDEIMLTPALTHRPTMMPGASDVLADVKAHGMGCALISNAGATPGFVLRQLLEDLGLLRYLDPAVFSDELEVSKPAEAIFAYTLGEMALDPTEAVFVGDQPLLDVFGSRRAGMWCVQIGDVTAKGIEPHARIGTLDELLPALRRLELIA